MTLRDYLIVLAKQWWILFSVAIVFGLIAYLVGVRQPTAFEGAITVSITNKSSATSNQFYTYDDYYSLQSNGILADMVSSWLTTPDFVQTVFDQVNTPLPAKNTKQLRKLLLYHKPTATSGILTVSYIANARETTTNILSATKSNIQLRLDELNNSKALTNDILYSISDPTIFEQKTNPLQQTLAALLAGLILSGLVIIIREYIRS